MLVGFVATPFILGWLGEERYGAFRALTDWGAYLQLLELGIGGALGAVISRTAIAGPDALRDAVAAGGDAYRGVAGRGLVAILALTIAAPWIIPVSDRLVGELRLASAIGVTTALGFLFVAARPALLALQRGYAVNVALAAQSIVITGAGLAFSASGFGMPGMAVAAALGTIVNSGVLLAMLARRDPRLPRALLGGGGPKNLKAELHKLRWPTFILRLGGTVSTLSDNIIVAWILGPAAVVPFFLTQRLPQLVATQVKGLGTASWAGLAEMHHRGEDALFRDRTVELTRIIVAANVSLLGPVLLVNQDFVTLWVGPQHYAGQTLTMLAVINSGVLALLSFWISLFAGTGRPRALVPLSVAASATNVIVSVVSTSVLGSIGPLVGSLAGVVGVYLCLIPFLLRREFGLPLGRVTRSVLGPLVASTPPLLVGAWVLRFIAGEASWVRVAGEYGCLCAALLAWNWRVVLTATERGRWRARFRMR